MAYVLSLIISDTGVESICGATNYLALMNCNPGHVWVIEGQKNHDFEETEGDRKFRSEHQKVV